MEMPPSSAGVTDILYILFKHRKKIIFFSLLGIAAAAATFFLHVPLYQSEAKLLVRYVVDKSAIDPESAAGASASRYFESAINSEVEILTSWDLAMQVAEKVGPEKLAPNPKGVDQKVLAARNILLGLSVVPGKGSNVILVSYKDHDPEMATQVLTEIITRYFVKHLEVHRSAGATQFVQEQTLQVENDLSGIETTLKNLKSNANIVSLSESSTDIQTQMAKTNDELAGIEAQLAEAQAQLTEQQKLNGTADSEEKKVTTIQDHHTKTGATSGQPTSGEIQEHSAIVTRLANLRGIRLELLAKYTEENQLVKLNRLLTNELEEQRRAIETKYPSLATTTVISGSGIPTTTDVAAEQAHIVGLKAKAETLRTRLAGLKKQAEDLVAVAPQIEKLERRKAAEEANYKYFSAAGEKARIDEALSALDPSKIPNISEVQKPTPAFRVLSDLKKILIGLTLGGIGLGIGIALLKEIFLDRSVKRPMELEAHLQIPLMLAIPMLGKSSSSRSRSRSNSSHSSRKALADVQPPSVAPWDGSHFIRPYADAMRDRLGLYFEVNNIVHKPKLIGVAGLTEGSGASTLAGGLAASLSETGAGKVLLVDMNGEHGELHPFFQGRPACSLSTALEQTNDIASAADNLYLASAAMEGSSQATRVGLRGLHELLPVLQASEFDFIIFDMPPVRQTNPTSAMAGFMDKILFVMESEACTRDLIKRSYSELIANRAKVSVVLNKVRSYAPTWIEGEI